MDIMHKISTALQIGDEKEVPRLVEEVLGQGVEANVILDQALIHGMNIIGEKFRLHEIFLPDVLLAARAMQAGMDIIKPLLEKSAIANIGKAVIGTVQGDLHDIGKNLVGIMLKGAGFDVVDLGKDVSAENFVNTAMETGADVIGLSALLTTTMPVMNNVVSLLKEKDSSGKIRVIIGGAPTSSEYASEIGADSHAFDAVSAVDQIKLLVNG